MAQDGIDEATEGRAGGGAGPGDAADGASGGSGGSVRGGGGGGADLMRRLLRQPAPPPDDSRLVSRALRQAMVRAAETAADLQLSVLGISVEEVELDTLVPALEEGLLLVGIAPPEAEDPAGFVAIDADTRSALIEAQTLGRLLPQPADPRPPTRADYAMAEPFAETLLAQIALEAAATPLSGWTLGQQPCGRLTGAREVGLRLKAGVYRQVALTLDFGVGERQGSLRLVLPDAGSMAATDGPAPAADDSWQPRLQAAVMGARSELRAVLHRLTMPIERAEALRIGDLLPLPGVSVASVQVEALDGRLIARARLGQMSGMRAVRIESPAAARMSEVPAVPRVMPVAAGPEGSAEAAGGAVAADPALPGLPGEVGSGPGAEGEGYASSDPDQPHAAASEAAPPGPVGAEAPSAFQPPGMAVEAGPAGAGGAGISVAHDLRPEDPPAAPFPAEMPATARAGRRRSDGLVVSQDAVERGSLDLSEEIDLARGGSGQG